ncbi:MAG: cysteine desulfurase [Bacteroidales bacterium]|nr:cysteine desulfurase [Bacteroidales bacterium]
MIDNIKSLFPILQQKVHDKTLVYLDNAASTQKPSEVIEAVENYYYTVNSNVHRGNHLLSQLATSAYEEARKTVQTFISAKQHYEIIFTRGTTEAINLVANSFCRSFVRQGDEIIVSHMEHHSNIVPWQLAAEQCGAEIKVIPVLSDGTLDIEAYHHLFSEKTKIVSITHVSNVLGTVNPVRQMIQTAHSYGVPVLVDGAQGIKSCEVNVQDLDCDFYCFSGHKIYAPMGIGVLYGKEKYLEKMLPYQGGGEMIHKVSFEKTTFNELPFKFEAGTPNVGGAVGLKSAIEFMQRIGIRNMIRHDENLLQYALQKMQNIEGIRFIGEAEDRASVISFLLGGSHPADAGTLLDMMGIAVRTGHHCAEPLMNLFHIPGTIRASFAIYNTYEDIDILVNAINKTNQLLQA